MNEIITQKQNGNDLQAKQAAEIINAVITKYETNTPPPDCSQRDRTYISWYRGLLIEIGSNIRKLSITDIYALDSLFKNVYIPLSIKNGITPKINDFCLLMGTDYSVIDKLLNNSNNHIYNSIYNSWLIICRESLLSDMIDSNSSNINHIFISKAVYGLTDNPQTKTDNTPARIGKDRQQIIAELTAGDVENS